MKDKQFKTKEAEHLYWMVKSDVSQFLYEIACCRYHEEYHKRFMLVQNLINKTGSCANLVKAVRKIEKVLKHAQLAFDLPEHPEKHNGFIKSWEYEEPIMKILGFSFK